MNSESIIYAETYEILSYMDKYTVMKIPMEILLLLKNKRDINYISKIDKHDIFNKNNIQKETLDLLAWLDLNYWANEEEKKDLLKRYTENERKAKEKLYFENNIKELKFNNVFDNKDTIKEEQLEKINELQKIDEVEETEEINQMIIHKESIFDKLKKFILNLIN